MIARLAQVLLVRTAALFWTLALRLGRSEGKGSAASFEEVARQRIAESPASLPVARARADGVEPPAGYLYMTPRAQLDASLASSLLLVDQDESTFIPIFVGPSEALAFRQRLERRDFPRPLTHDLFDALLAQVHASLLSVRIDAIRADVFIATLVIELADERVVELDARASDAIVLALGNRAPIVVAADVVAQAGRPLESAPLDVA